MGVIPIVIGLGLVMYVLYTVVAELVLHLWHVSVFYQGMPDTRTVALTFDDGPDPLYTPQVLDILLAHGVRATFFLVAERAEKYPELILRMVREGHVIASHGMVHRHAWLRSPWGTARDVKRAWQSLEALSGQPIHFHRPPWGAMNWALWRACRQCGIKLCLWSVRAMDWTLHATPDEIWRHVVGPVAPGSVVLCHDSGGANGAPARTIEALPRIIRSLDLLGYTFSTIEEMYNTKQKTCTTSVYRDFPRARRVLLLIWSMVEYIFTRLYRVHTQNAMFRVSRAKWHHGKRLDPAGLPLLQDGDDTLDIHFRNDTLIALSSNSANNRAVIRSLKLAKDGLKDIARILQFHPIYSQFQAIASVTLMNRGIEMLGFHVEPLPQTFETKRLQLYMQFLMAMYHPEGFRRLHQGRQTLTLKLVWMSREEVIARYGEPSLYAGPETESPSEEVATNGMNNLFIAQSLHPQSQTQT